MKLSPIRKQAQAGFTLIELIVVIVILGILAATALPRMFDMSGQARLAKMQAALGAVKASASTAHAAWLMNGGVLGCVSCSSTGTAVTASVVVAEGNTIPTRGGYPDVGGDGYVNTATDTAASGIAIAANLAADYQVTTNTPGTTTATNNTFTVTPDVSHPLCRFTYTEAVQTNSAVTNVPSTFTSAPTYTTTQLDTVANCG